jgi:hypothetical protein
MKRHLRSPLSRRSRSVGRLDFKNANEVFRGVKDSGNDDGLAGELAGETLVVEPVESFGIIAQEEFAALSLADGANDVLHRPLSAAKRVMLLLGAGILTGILGERHDREGSGQDERSEKQSETRRIRTGTLQIAPLLIQDWPVRAERCNREANPKLP